MNDIMWEPSADMRRNSNLAAFMAAQTANGVSELRPADDPDAYATVYDWSVADPAAFWAAAWRWFGIIADERPSGDPWDSVVHGLERMAPPDVDAGPRWFSGSRLNVAENLLRYADDAVAIIATGETGRRRQLTFAELRAEVAACAGALQEAGVGPGDRVAACLPNIPETVIAMLATTALGAVWSSSSPDFGVPGILDRFGQVAPRVLLCADGYTYAGKSIDTLGRAADVARQLPSVVQTVIVAHQDPEGTRDLATIPKAVGWREWLADHRGTVTPPFDRGPFDRAALILFSSGTTGLPKCIVHGAGGPLLQLLKEQVLQTDVRRGDRVFYYTTCGWMMWNWLVAALGAGATIVLYDGAAAARPSILWDLAQDIGITVFGTSARYLAQIEKLGLTPAATHDLSRLRAILSTGSPLAAHSFDYVYRDVKPDVWLASISGGTDIVSCFALGNPLSPVRRGELQGRGLGLAVDVFDAAGRPVRDVAGELVCTQPFPSMPIAFWNDPGQRKYREAYFTHFPGVWRHGDWARLTSTGGLIIYGRSDTTLNPGGVRIGTAEIYRQVETVPEVLDSVAVEHVIAGEGRVLLFVQLAAGHVLDAALEGRIKMAIRRNTSPHHVPALIRQVADIPRTVNGKIAEVAVRESIHGRPVTNVEALANPGALAEYRALAPSLNS